MPRELCFRFHADCCSYDTGTISGVIAMPYWDQTFSTGYRDSTGKLTITSSQTSAIVSILSAGTFFGALGAAPMGDIIGRRWGLIISNGVFVLGVALQTAATAIPLFLAGRFFAGFGVGLISALGECYLFLVSGYWDT
jgi:MFS transporter, SP family, sugar:H+ symporter